ncbi:MAG TPA: phosphate transport system regulatory protein PhoU, partial [Syntrophaceae bacterium]|nr:phosphate transport system regulatory protein PhoU [Syntrophaceae bacterium]HCS77257.1 phosphate transport system regulatory protein PhoU [Syntrophaceae bacterium]
MEEKRHTSLHYEKELQEIKDGLIYQGALTEKAIQLAMRSLSERNSEIAKRVIKDDEEIDKLDTDLE